MSIIYFEKDFLAEDEAKLPVADRGFQFGDGVFLTIQVKDGIPFFLEEHLEQLQRQCLAFNLVNPLVGRFLIEELIKRNQAYQGVWKLKLIVTGGDSAEARLPERQGRIIMFIHPFSPQPFKPLKMGVFPIPYYACHASFKSLAHLNRFYVMEEAHRRGLDDCVTVTEKEIILEASFGNLFWVKEKTFFTPDPSLPLYFGVTIKKMIKLAEELGFEIRYVKMKAQELPEEASAFRTNTMQGVRPIAQIETTTFRRNLTLESLFINGYAQILEQQRVATYSGNKN